MESIYSQNDVFEPRDVCLSCGESIEQTAGKRAKLFCGVTCRSGYWQKRKRLTEKIGAEAPPPIYPIAYKRKRIMQEISIDNSLTIPSPSKQRKSKVINDPNAIKMYKDWMYRAPYKAAEQVPVYTLTKQIFVYTVEDLIL